MLEPEVKMDAIIGMAAPRPRTKALFSWAVVAQRTMTICERLDLNMV